jgi:hypothetical protein
VLAVIAFFGLVSPAAANAVGNDCAPNNPLASQAEMFATNSTEEIDNPSDARLGDRLDQFESQVNGVIFRNGAIPVGSELVNGIFWSDDRNETTYEPSRDFHIACVDDRDMTQIAKEVAAQFNQESVLVFTDSPNNDPDAASFVAHVLDIDVQRFHDALAADPAARSNLGGGSITDDGTLVLAASTKDTAVAERVVSRAGGHLDMSTVQRGESNFVSADDQSGPVVTEARTSPA